MAIKAVDLHSERINTALQEVYLMQKLHHGNLVALKRVMRTESHLYIVMELCEAELRDVMKDLGGRLSEPVCCRHVCARAPIRGRCSM